MSQNRALKPGELSEMIRASGEAIVAEAEALIPEIATYHPAAGEWSVHEIVGHLIEAENRGFAGRVRQLLAEDRPKLDTWDQDEVAAARRDDERRLPDLLKEFMRLRQASTMLLFRLKAADFERGGEHPQVGFLTVGDIVNEWVHHDRTHLKQMATNVQSYVWEHMGAARRFSEG